MEYDAGVEITRERGNVKMTTIGTTEHNESVEVKKSLKDDAHSNEKADSGMDDDSQQSNEQDAQCNVSDEEEILITKKSKQSKRILDDDSEEEMTLVEEDNDAPPNDLQRPESNLPMTTDESMNEAQDHGSGNDSGSDDEESLSRIINRKKKRIVGVFDDDSNDSVKESEKIASEPSEQNKQLFGNSDLFDAEDDVDESLQGEDNPCSNKADNSDSDKADNSDSGSNSNCSEDEGFNENSIDPKLLAKLKKGAAKKPSRTSKAKSRQDEMLDLHSETQRLVRESRVNIPYHQPEPKPLSDFLARASRKQELYRSLHNTRDIHKARIMQETFEKEKVSRQSEREKSQINPSEKVTDTRTNEESVSSEKLESQTENEDAVSENNHEKKSFIENQLGENELPDLEERETEAEKRLGLNDSSQSAEDPTKSVREDGKEENCDSAIQSDNATSNTQCTESIDIKEKQSSERDSEGHAAELVADHTKVKDSKLPFLLEPDLPHLSAVPRLSGGPDAVISLDEGGPDAVISLDEEETGIPQHPGVKKLMGRFMDHSKKRAKHVSKDVSIKIVEKDKDELHMKTFTYHPTQDDENSLQALDVPGAKLMALKEKLQETMKAKREESRKQRQDIYDLDNEEGYVAEDEDAILDDDAEMSEHSDTDVEDDEFDEQFGEDEEMEDEETKEERNPFADDEAEEEDDDDGENLKLHLSDDDDDDAVEDREKNTVDEEGGDLAIQLKSSGKKKKPRVLQISDDEESRDNNMEDRENVTGAEGGVWEDTQANKMEDGSLFKEPDDDLFVPFSKHGTQQVTQAQEMKGSSSFIPPIEDSQDLYGSTPAILSGNDSQPSQSLNFYIEESQSRMFDADGFLRTGSTGKKPKLKPFMSFDTDSSQEHYDELLGLCSGRFQDSESENRKGSCKQQLFGSIANTQNNMDELMGLCSGKFAEGSAKGGKQLFETQAGTQNMEELVGLCSGKFGKSYTGGERSQTTGVKRKSPLDEEEENSNDSFKLVSDHEEEDDVNNEKDVFSDDERNEDEDDERSRDSEGSRPEKFTGFTVADKHGKIRREFVEAEAELSGSEYDSDENLDLAEEDDILEMEEGDKDQVGTEEELRNQVGRAHLKQVIDADKRELMRFQEMYLPDGDLHSEGQGRIRRFKWSNMDDDTQQDMFNEDSDGENIEEIDQDSKWRQERYEREKFLQEQEEKDKNEDENSQFLKFGKVFLKRSNSESGPLKKPSVKKIVSKENAPQTVVNTIFKQSMQKKGSFLGRNKETLAKIAELTKSSANPTGPRNSRNFVFQVIAQDKDTNTQDAMPAPSEGKVRKAHKPKQQKPVAKKPRLEKSASFPQNSIFNLM